MTDIEFSAKISAGGLYHHQNDHLSGRMADNISVVGEWQIAGVGLEGLGGCVAPKWFGRGSQGTIFVRISKISLYWPEFGSFRRVICFPCFYEIWCQPLERLSFLFPWRCVGGLYETRLCHRASSCELRQRPRYFLKMNHFQRLNEVKQSKFFFFAKRANTRKQASSSDALAPTVQNRAGAQCPNVPPEHRRPAAI